MLQQPLAHLEMGIQLPVLFERMYFLPAYLVLPDLGGYSVLYMSSMISTKDSGI